MGRLTCRLQDFQRVEIRGGSLMTTLNPEQGCVLG